MDRSQQNSVPLWLYIINATLLTCHEIDSAYWREWELFHLPGGADLFVALHLPLVGLILWGLVLIAREQLAGRWFALGLGVAGLAGGLLHGWFLLHGDSRFRSPVSIALIVAFLFVSALQIAHVFLSARQCSAASRNEPADIVHEQRQEKE